MTRFDRYILREAAPYFLAGVLLYAGLVLLTNLLGRVQYVSSFPITAIATWLWYQVPFVVNQTLPVGVLLATLLAYGRLVRENELLALQAGGVSILASARWLFVAATVLVGFSLYLNQAVIPVANQKAAIFWWEELSREGSGLARLAGEEIQVGPYNLYFEQYNEATDLLETVRLTQWQGTTLTVIFASSGSLKDATLALSDPQLYTLDLASLPLPELASLEAADLYLRQLIRVQNSPAQPGTIMTIALPETRDQVVAEQAGGGFEDPNSISHWYQALRNATTPQESQEARVMLHSLLAIPFANLIVLFVAIPVAVQRSGSAGRAFGISLILTLLYYALFTIGKLLASNGVVSPEIGLWSANILLLIFGFIIGKGVYR